MITILNIREAKRDQFDEVWAIVRFYKGKSDWIKQVTELSPSHMLWAKYHKLKLNGEWNKTTFNDIYVPTFLNEMRQEPAKGKLNELYQADKAGKSIALACFCPDESLCHRSIVAGLLQGVGCNVHIPSGADYSSFYRRYKMEG